eukprot:14811-Heterococcus_DN1.PRE.2
MLTALISSLLSANYPYIDIILLDTDTMLDSREWMNNTATMLNSRSDNRSRRKDVHISSISQRDVKRRFPQIVAKDFGALYNSTAATTPCPCIHNSYPLSDIVIHEELQTMPGLPKCEYVMLTNGDNVYSNHLIATAMPALREKIDLVG